MFLELIEKCDGKQIAYEELRNSLIIEIPEARQSRTIRVPNKLIKMISENEIDFLEYKFIPGYSAIWSEAKKIIECGIESRHSFSTFQKLYCKDKDEIVFSVGKYEVEISQASLEFAFLINTEKSAHYILIDESRIKQDQEFTITMKLSVDDLKTSDDAIKIVETLIESLCFEISCAINNVFSPSVPRKIRRSNKRDESDINSFKLNKKIDKNALAYYWNAESAHRFPLIQYLGYYQVVEYFYSHFSDKELHSKIGIILKDSKFNLHNSRHINKIVEENRKFFNNNKDQTKLELTIKSSLREEDFREWYDYEDQIDNKNGGEILSRKQYFSGKKCSKISDKKIDSRSDSELLKQALERFYDIRCRIVHSDSSNDDKDLNPRMHYDNFIHDIELAKFFAQKVLLATSTEF